MQEGIGRIGYVRLNEVKFRFGDDDGVHEVENANLRIISLLANAS